MNMKMILAAALASAVFNISAVQASECGLSCCIAAGVDGVGSANGLSVTAQYDYMTMKTIKQGLNTVALRDVIQKNLSTRTNGSRYGGSTEMVMQKFSVNAAYRINQESAVVLTVPYLINDMKMEMGMKMMGNVSFNNTTMDTVQGVGDVSLVYLHDVYKDDEYRTRKRLSLGFGLKVPTGKHDTRKANADLIHMMMQAGSGSYDFLFLANGTMGLGEHADGGAQWLFNPSLTYQANTRNNLGYKLGNRLNFDISSRYRVSSALNVKLDMKLIYAAKDSSDQSIDAQSGKVAYQNPMMSMIDHVANTGITSVFIAPGFQWVISPSVIASAEYRIPLYQNAGGIQQVTDNWFLARVSTRF
ncbi:MAG: hypothetical protein Q9M28_11680 [Mariprofundaceae bacterium]|nr:hypothetical protein [Mariprofundaceae bacterium]